MIKIVEKLYCKQHQQQIKMKADKQGVGFLLQYDRIHLAYVKL